MITKNSINFKKLIINFILIMQSSLFKTTIAKGFTVISSYMVLIFLTNILLVNDVDLIYTNLTVIHFTSIIFLLGIDRQIIKNNHKRHLINSTFITSIIQILFFSLIIFLIGLILLFTNPEIFIKYKLFFVLSGFYSMIIMISAYLKSKGKGYYGVLLEFGFPNFVIFIILFYGKVFLVQNIINLFIAVYSLVAIIFVVKIYLKNDMKLTLIKLDPLKRKLYIFWTNICDYLIVWYPPVVIHFFGNAEASGTLQVISRVSLILSLSLVIINTVTFPKYSKLIFKKNYTLLNKIYSQTRYLGFGISFLIFVFFLIFNEKLFQFMNIEGNIIFVAFIVLCVAQLVNVFFGSVNNILLLIKNGKSLFIIVLTSLLSSILIFIILYPISQIFSAVITIFYSIMIKNLLSFLTLKKMKVIY